MRNIETIDGELGRLAAIRHMLREAGGAPNTGAGHVADAWQCGEDELVGQRCVADFPIHLATKLVGHNNIDVAQGYTAVYQKDVFDAYARFITNRAGSPDRRA
jgi:hypothetical protein